MRQPSTAQQRSREAKTNAALAALLTLLFSYAALSKAIIFPEFQRQLAHQPFPRQAAAAMAYGIPALELLAAILLTAPRARKAGWWLSFLLMAAFTAYAALTVAGFWAILPCACGGILGRMPWRIHLAFNVLFFAVTITGILTCKERREGDP